MAAFGATSISDADQIAITTDVDRRIQLALAQAGIEVMKQSIVEIGDKVKKVLEDGQEVVDKIGEESLKFDEKSTGMEGKIAREFERLETNFSAHTARGQEAERRIVELQQAMVDMANNQRKTKDESNQSAKLEIERLTQNVKGFLQEEMGKIGAGGGGAQDHRSQLNSPKETAVEVIPEGISKGAFQLWRDNLDLHLEGFKEFGAGVSGLLRQVRLGISRPGKATVEHYANEVNKQSNGAGHGSMFQGWWSYEIANRELYKFLHKRLNVALKSETCLCPQHDGFELYRSINAQLDPKTDVSEHLLLSDVRRLAFVKNKNLMETQAAIIRLERTCKEYNDKSSLYVPDTEKTFAVWMFMDDDSKDRLERKGLKEGKTEYKEVIGELDMLRNDGINRRALIDYGKKQSDKMDLSMVAAEGDQVGQEGPTLECPPCGDALDNLSGIQCHKCQGWGHRMAQCTSKQGLEIQCHNCGGWGHYAADCPSASTRGDRKGKGKGDAAAPNSGQKGNNKGAWEKGNGKANGGKAAWDKGGGKLKGKAGAKAWGKGGKSWGKGKGLGMFGEWAEEVPWGYGGNPWGQGGAYSMTQQPNVLTAPVTAPGGDPGSWMRRLTSFVPKTDAPVPVNRIDTGLRILCPMNEVKTDEEGFNEAIRWRRSSRRKAQQPKLEANLGHNRGYWAEALGDGDTIDDEDEEVSGRQEEAGKQDTKIEDNLIVHVKIRGKEDKKSSARGRNKKNRSARRRARSEREAAREMMECPSEDSDEDYPDLADSSDEEDNPSKPDRYLSEKQLHRRKLRKEREMNTATKESDRTGPSASHDDWPHVTEDDRPGMEISQDALGNPKSKRQKAQQDHLLESLEGGILTFDADTEKDIPITTEKEATAVPRTAARSKTRKKGSIVTEMKKFIKDLNKKLRISPRPDRREEPHGKDQGMAHNVTVEASGGCTAIGSAPRLNPFWEKESATLNAMSPAQWTLIEVIVDSGACETVLPASLCAHIKLRESAASKAKVEYEVASGKAVPNLGEKHCEVFAEGGSSSMLMHFQVADIHRPLLSLSRCADQGFRSYLDYWGGWLEDTKTGESIPITRRGNLYIMQMWIRGAPDEVSAPGFPGRG